MAINTDGIKKKYSLEHISNMGFDEEFQVPVFELLSYDPVANAMKRVTTNAFGEYGTNDIEETGSVTYIGKEDPSGDWYIQKIDTSTGTQIRYATASNNGAVSDYTAAWTDRAGLTYGTYAQAF